MTHDRKEKIHLFVASGRFRSFEEMRTFIDKTYTEDGDAVPSQFIKEVELSSYEPGCIEATHSEIPKPLPLLLKGCSYGEQWLSQVPSSLVADSAICVFPPNVVKRPEATSLTYVGEFTFSRRSSP